MQKCLLPLFLLFVSALSLRAEAPWPGVAYQEVRAYAWDPDPRLAFNKPYDHLLINDDMTFADGVLNKEGAVLNADQVKRLLKAETRRFREPRARAGCYNPHNAFVFFDASHKPVAFLEVCFDCVGARTNPADGQCDPDFIALAAICAELKLPFGEYKTLKEFNKHAAWVLNPVGPIPPGPK